MTNSNTTGPGVIIKKIFTLIIVIAFVLGVSCAQPPRNSLVNPDNFRKITAGMPREDVIRILGEPDSRLRSRPCKCADIETFSYLSGKIGIDVKIYNGKVCEKNLIEFSKFEIHD